MGLDDSSDILIRRYLLADVSEDELGKIETRLMTDDIFLQQINLVEDELIDQYLDGDLDSADQRRFEESFLCAPERQQKLRFAKALHTYVARSAQEQSEKTPWWRSFHALFNPPRPVLAYAFAAALLLIVAGGPWVAVRIVGLKGQISSLKAQQQERDAGLSQLRSQVEAEKARADEIARRLQQEKPSRGVTQTDAGSQVQLAMLNPPPFLLSPGVQRGQTSSSVVLPRSSLVLRLKLDLSQNPHQTYRVVLLSEGQEILSQSQLKARESASAITIGLQLPAEDLPSGDYELRLYGTGVRDYLESYVFHLVRK